MAPRKCCMPYCRTEDSNNKQFFKLDVEDFQKVSSIAGCPITTNYCCQNHYDVANDTKNFIRYKYQPGRQLALRPGVLPHRKIPINVCRVCLKIIFKEDEFVVASEQKAPEKADVIKTCLPELDLSLTIDPIVCQKCFTSLQSYYKIKKQSLKTEVTVVKSVKEVAKKDPNKLIKSCAINLFEHYDLVQNIRSEIEFKEGVQIVNLDEISANTMQVQQSENIKNEAVVKHKTTLEHDPIDLDAKNDIEDQLINDRHMLEDQNAVKNLAIMQDPDTDIYRMVYIDQAQAGSSTSEDVAFGNAGQF